MRDRGPNPGEFVGAVAWGVDAAETVSDPLERLGGHSHTQDGHSKTAESDSRLLEAKLVRLADVKPERVEWLWPGRIPLGKLTLLDGDPGVGKSTLAVHLAAQVSIGGRWPDDTDCPTGGVVLLSAEDGLSDTVRPRLDAAGADSTRIVALEAVPAPDATTTANRSNDSRTWPTLDRCGKRSPTSEPSS